MTTEVDLTQVQCITCGNLAEDKSRCLETGLTYSSAGEREMLRPCEGWTPIPEPDNPDETPAEETPEGNGTPPDGNGASDEGSSNNDTIVPNVIECHGSTAITIILPHEDYEVLSLYIERSKK